MSPDDFREAISNALQAGDMEAATDILRVMAGVHPREAAEVLEEINVGLRIAGRRS